MASAQPPTTDEKVFMDVDINVPDQRFPRRFEGERRPTAAPAGFRRSGRLAHASTADGDRRLVAAAQAGDRDAMRQLYLRFKDDVYGYVCSIVRDEHEAEDVTQQVFAKVLHSLGSYRPVGTVPFSGWLLRIARNMAIDHLRQRRPTPEEDVPERGVQPIERMMAGVTLRAALDELPEDQRHVVMLRHVIGLTPVEIAHRLGRTESSVHALHHRGRQRLRAELTRVGAAPTSQRLAS